VATDLRRVPQTPPALGRIDVGLSGRRGGASIIALGGRGTATRSQSTIDRNRAGVPQQARILDPVGMEGAAGCSARCGCAAVPAPSNGKRARSRREPPAPVGVVDPKIRQLSGPSTSST
jgi:hypothetical protein